MVPEGRRIFSRMTVMENLQMGAVLGEELNFDVEAGNLGLLIMSPRKGIKGKRFA